MSLLARYVTLEIRRLMIYIFFFFNDTATTEIYTLSLHDALPICSSIRVGSPARAPFPKRPPTPSEPVKIADVRVTLADIPVKRPHKMSFTTLEAVNFAFVRVQTADGLTGWGEAACLGGPTWSDESSESA